jgi:hypothetical protein
MSTRESGERWTVEVTDGVMIWEFLPGMELDAFEEEVEDLLADQDLDGMVTVVNLDDPFSAEVLDTWEQTARRLNRTAVSRWAIVAEGIKAISLQGKVDVGSLETMTTEDRAEAVDWARTG